MSHEAFPVYVITLYHVRKLNKRKGQIFPMWNLSVNYEWYWESAIWSYADTLYSRRRAEKMFCMKILLILPTFHEKTFWRFFVQGGGRTCTLPLTFMDEELWPGGNFLGGGIFQGGVWWVGIFPGEIFLEPFWQMFLNNVNFFSQQIISNLTKL